jgi:hypothetical protein
MSAATHDDLATLRSLAAFEVALRAALRSLRGTTCNGGRELYTFHTADLLHAALEGYIHLRGAGMVDASKQLIRPALEMSFRLRALNFHPELIFQYAYSEYKEDRKWANSLPAPTSHSTVAGVEEQWKNFKNEFMAARPGEAALEQELSVYDLAAFAELTPYYNTHYRLYCRYTHASLWASSGEMVRFEPEDNRTMAFCATVALESLESLGVAIPEMPDLLKRLHAFPASP